MSLHTQEFSKAMEKYVATLTKNGIHVVVSAGIKVKICTIHLFYSFIFIYLFYLSPFLLIK